MRKTWNKHEKLTSKKGYILLYEKLKVRNNILDQYIITNFTQA